MFKAVKVLRQYFGGFIVEHVFADLAVDEVGRAFEAVVGKFGAAESKLGPAAVVVGIEDIEVFGSMVVLESAAPFVVAYSTGSTTDVLVDIVAGKGAAVVLPDEVVVLGKVFAELMQLEFVVRCCCLAGFGWEQLAAFSFLISLLQTLCPLPPEVCISGGGLHLKKDPGLLLWC